MNLTCLSLSAEDSVPACLVTTLENHILILNIIVKFSQTALSLSVYLNQDFETAIIF